jgi:electron transfer flavoprotein alpha subunit
MELHAPPLRRINPRRPYVIAASGLKRIVLGAEVGSRDLHHATHAARAKPLRTTAAAVRSMLVVVHSDRGALDEHARQAIAAAALLADAQTQVVVAVLGGTSEQLGEAAADVVIDLPDADASAFRPERQLALLQQLIASYQPTQIFMPDRGADADLGRRLAARTQKRIATDVVELDAKSACRIVPGARYARCSLPDIVLLARNAASASLPFIGHGRCEDMMPLAHEVSEAVHDLGVEVSPPDQIALEEADFILSAGNGMRDMDTFNSLAQALGAATGASRVAVDDGRFARTKQIGATGKTVQASTYLALGISGAVQHLQGIKDCRHVIAVNLDESAPIVKRAGLALIEDAQALMQALLPLVRQARSRPHSD